MAGLLFIGLFFIGWLVVGIEIEEALIAPIPGRTRQPDGLAGREHAGIAVEGWQPLLEFCQQAGRRIIEPAVKAFARSIDDGAKAHFRFSLQPAENGSGVVAAQDVGFDHEVFSRGDIAIQAGVDARLERVGADEDSGALGLTDRSLG